MQTLPITLRVPLETRTGTPFCVVHHRLELRLADDAPLIADRLITLKEPYDVTAQIVYGGRTYPVRVNMPAGQQIAAEALVETPPVRVLPSRVEEQTVVRDEHDRIVSIERARYDVPTVEQSQGQRTMVGEWSI